MTASQIQGRVKEANHDENRVPAYVLPDPLIAADGSVVSGTELPRKSHRPCGSGNPRDTYGTSSTVCDCFPSITSKVNPELSGLPKRAGSGTYFGGVTGAGAEDSAGVATPPNGGGVIDIAGGSD
jgi:hypothetical protein